MAFCPSLLLIWEVPVIQPQTSFGPAGLQNSSVTTNGYVMGARCLVGVDDDFFHLRKPAGCFWKLLTLRVVMKPCCTVVTLNVLLHALAMGSWSVQS